MDRARGPKRRTQGGPGTRGNVAGGDDGTLGHKLDKEILKVVS